MKKILVIEDDQQLRAVLEDKFNKEGYAVEVAENGQIGLEMALSTNPDLILLDLVMPVMDGMTTLHELKRNQKTLSIPVILLTNLSDSDKAVEAASNGVYDYLVKSDWKLEDILIKVAEKLSDK